MVRFFAKVRKVSCTNTEPALMLFGDGQRLGLGAGDHRGRETESGVVGKLHGFIQRPEPHHRNAGTEGFILHDEHAVRDVRQHGRAHVQAAAM
jgi:hypothetical protein